MNRHVSSFFVDFEGEGARTVRKTRFVDRLRAWVLPSGRAALAPEPASEAHEAITQLHSVLSNPAVRERLRGYLSRRCGSANVDFLIGYWTFTKSTNALERFQQLQFIVHAFAREGRTRSVDMGEASRLSLLRDWETWARRSRVPAEAKLPGLDAAAGEIEHAVLAHSTLMPVTER